MLQLLTAEQREASWSKIELEEDELVFYTEKIEGEGKHFILTGKAVVEGETYHDFQIEIQLLEETAMEAENILNADWDWYDFVFD